VAGRGHRSQPEPLDDGSHRGGDPMRRQGDRGAGDAPPGVLIFNDGVAPRSFNEENGEVKGLDWSLRTMSDIECFPATAKAFTVRTPHHGHFLFVFSV
jgi:hypothetical protein